ncbi:MAG: MBL fold metallo-hydrolase [Candidatus Magasanikbacteria bacterium]|nr:MBL fold metallo-hydrolase [Candidatus Magasanikbacteria bacterium]
MRITKFGHSCLLVEEASARILIDPGIWSTIPSDVKTLDAILITHEHLDHLNIEWLQKNLSYNSQVVIYTNQGVGKKLEEAKLPFRLLENGQTVVVGGVSVEAFGKDHAIIYPVLQHLDNTGFLIGGKLFHPGDSLYVPLKPIEILALPVCAPWSKVSEVIDYAKAVKPKIAFPIHDGMLKITTGFHKMPETFLSQEGINWEVIEDGKSIEV